MAEEKRTIADCVHIAFGYVQRSNKAISKIPKQDRAALREDIERLIVRCLDNFFMLNLSGQDDFDAWHGKVCSDVLKAAEMTDNSFTYGIAQYLLNFTLEEMLITEWAEQLEPIKKYLHVPVYSKTIQAAWEDMEIVLLCKNGAADSKSWKQWDYSEYTAFQEAVRNAVPCPIDWGHSLCINDNTEGAL